MPNSETTRLRIESYGGFPLAEVREFLAALEHAYNGLVAFEDAINGHGDAQCGMSVDGT
jgi:hypothetical protein